MLDRILASSLWLSVLVLICATGCLSLIFGFAGTRSLLLGHSTGGATAILGACLLGWACHCLCRHAPDLMDQ